MSSTPDSIQTSATTPIVLTFHKVVSGFTWGSTNFSPKRLDHLLRILKDRGYDLNNQVVLSFDDGYAHLADTLPPLIEAFGLRATVFVPTAWLGRSNDWDYSHLFRNAPHLSREEVRRMAGFGVEFGTHGHTHRDLRYLEQNEMRRELSDSKSCLEDIIGRPITSVSYPFGGVSEQVIQTATELGYDTGYTMRFPRPDDPPLARGRLAVYGFDTPFSILQKIARGPLYRIEEVKVRITNSLSAGTRLFNRLRGRS